MKTTGVREKLKLNHCSINNMSHQPEIIEQLNQLKTATWDGDLISKYLRDLCVNKGLAQRSKCGWNVITAEGLSVLVEEDGLWPMGNQTRGIDTLTELELTELAKLIYGESYEADRDSLTYIYQSQTIADAVINIGKRRMEFNEAISIYKYLKSINVEI